MPRNILFYSLLVSIFFSFTACKENQEKTAKAETNQVSKLTAEQTNKYTEAGKEIASKTFKELSGKLKSSLEEGGVQNAVEYCNVVALPLTDSLSQIHGAEIKRTSFKLRNPQNKSTVEEFKMMQTFEKMLNEGEKPSPVVDIISQDSVQFYAPIVTQTLCLTCHGTIGQELTEENYSIIKNLYPEDKAIGYKENELRGIWSIKMKK